MVKILWFVISDNKFSYSFTLLLAWSKGSILYSQAFAWQIMKWFSKLLCFINSIRTWKFYLTEPVRAHKAFSFITSMSFILEKMFFLGWIQTHNLMYCINEYVIYFSFTGITQAAHISPLRLPYGFEGNLSSFQKIYVSKRYTKKW